MKKTALKAAALAISLTLSATAAWSAEPRGRELAGSLGCIGCHKIEGKGGSVGPALDGVGKRMSADQIQKILVDPKAKNPKSSMPSYKHLPQEDLKALAGYLSSLK